MHGKNPTRKQKIYLDSHGCRSESWLILKDTTEYMEIKHRKNGRVEMLSKHSGLTFEFDQEEVPEPLWWVPIGVTDERF